MAAQFDPISQETKNAEAKAESREARQDVKDSYENIRTDISQLAESVKKLAGSEFGGAFEGAQENAQVQLGRLENSIRDKPMQAALIAAGAGFLVGLLISR